MRERYARAEDKKKFEDAMNLVANTMVSLQNMVAAQNKMVDRLREEVQRARAPVNAIGRPPWYADGRKNPGDVYPYESDRKVTPLADEYRLSAEDQRKYEQAKAAKAQGLNRGDFTIEMWAKHPSEQAKADALAAVAQGVLGGIAKARSGL